MGLWKNLLEKRLHLRKNPGEIRGFCFEIVITMGHIAVTH